MTTKQDNMNRNPEGKGGFADNPQNRSDGGWNKEMVFSYQYKRFMNMSVTELKAFVNTPDDKKTVVEDLAFSAVLRARKSLPDVKEMTDRTEGRAAQSIDLTSKGEQIQGATIVFEKSPEPED